MAKTVYTCDICGVGDFASPQKMGAHKRKEHPGQPKNPGGNTSRHATKKPKKALTLAEAIHVLGVKRDALDEVISVLTELGRA